MTRSSNPSRELAALRERRIDLMISINLMEEKGTPREDIDAERVALLSVNSRITTLEKSRMFGRKE